MAAPELKRSYNLSDADLLQRADALIATLNRDQADLAARGVNAARINGLQQVRNQFDQLTTDVEEQSGVSMAATAKDAARTQLEKTIRRVRGMAEAKYGLSGNYKTFGFEDMTNLSDNDLVRCGRRVARVATTLEAQLTTEGLTQLVIMSISTETAALDAAVDAVSAAGEQRDIRTQERITAGNALFEQLAKLAKIGQSFYADTDEARYNDYIIDDRPAPSAPPSTP